MGNTMIYASADSDYVKAVEKVNEKAKGKYVVNGGMFSQMFLIKDKEKNTEKQVPFTIAWILAKE